jgi:hypothetical protein
VTDVYLEIADAPAAVVDGLAAALETRAADPQAGVAEAIGFVHDPWLVRRLPALLRGAGVTIVRVRSYGDVET